MMDDTREVASITCPVGSAHRALAEQAAAMALQHVPKQPTQARSLVSVGHDAELVKLLKKLTRAIGGLPMGRKLSFQLCGTDPSVVSSAPRRGAFQSGGPCSVHQDYLPLGEFEAARSITFYLLLQDTPEEAGPTFVYAKSRGLPCRERQPIAKRPRGRPPKPHGRSKGAASTAKLERRTADLAEPRRPRPPPCASPAGLDALLNTIASGIGGPNAAFIAHRSRFRSARVGSTNSQRR